MNKVLKSLSCTLLAMSIVFGTAFPEPAKAQRGVAETIVQTALKEYKAGHYRESLRMFKQAQEMSESGNFGPQAMEIILTGVGECQRSMGDYKNAEETFKKAAAVSESIPAKQRRNLYVIYNDLAILYSDLGKFAEAEGLMKQSEAIQKNNFLAVGNLAHLYYQWGKGDELRTYLDKSGKIAKVSRDPLAPIFYCFNAGNYLTLKGQYKGAETSYKEGMKLCEKQFGTTHFYYTILLSGLAVLYRLEARYSDAEKTMREVVELRTKTFFADHPETVRAQIILATILCEEGKYSEAKTLVEKSMKALQGQFGDDDSLFTARARQCLGNIERQDGHYQEAADQLEKAMAVQQRILGKEHLQVAESMDDLSKVRADQANFKEAESLLVEAKQIVERATGPNHPYRAKFSTDLGHLYLRENKFAEAEPQFKSAVELNAKSFGVNHSDTADSTRDLGEVYLKQKKYAEASVCLQNALKIDEQLYGANAPQLAATLSMLSKAEQAQGKDQDAASLTIRANELKKQLPGASAPEVATPDAGVSFSKGNDKPIREKWALAVGISNFKDSSINLKFAAKDATDFKNFLVNKEKFKPDHVRLLTDDQATRENIISNMGSKWLGKVVHPDDLVILYISSHGSRAVDDAKGVNFLVAHDTDKNSLLATGIPMQWLTKMVKDQVPSNRVVLILDVCHSGSAAQGGKALFRAPVAVDPTKITIGNGQMILCSSLAEQVSWESKNYENSVFTRRLIEALQVNNDKTTILEAYKQLKVLVENEVLKDRANLQTPILWNKDWLGNDPVIAVETK